MRPCWIVEVEQDPIVRPYRLWKTLLIVEDPIDCGNPIVRPYRLWKTLLTVEVERDPIKVE